MASPPSREEGELPERELSKSQKKKLRNEANKKRRLEAGEPSAVQAAEKMMESKHVKEKLKEQNGFVRHWWFSQWWCHIVNFNDEEDKYRTPGSRVGLMDMVAHLRSLTETALWTYSNVHNKQLVKKHEDPIEEGKSTQAWLEAVPTRWKAEYEMWIGSSHRSKWLATPEGSRTWDQWLRIPDFLNTRKEIALQWQQWFEHATPGPQNRTIAQRDLSLGEPISDGRIQFLDGVRDLTEMDAQSMVAQGVHGKIYHVAFVKSHHSEYYGDKGCYVAKSFKRDPNTLNIFPEKAFNIMTKEMSSCTRPHCGLIRPIACISNPETPILVYPYWNGGTLEDMLRKVEGRHADQRDPETGYYTRSLTMWEDDRVRIFKKQRLELGAALLETLAFLHRTGWLHNDLHTKNILLHFPDWEWTANGKRTIVMNPTQVFIGIADFGISCYATNADADSSFHVQHDWTHIRDPPPAHLAPELHNHGVNPYWVTASQPFTEFTDVYALGVTLRKMCGGFFTQMSEDEKSVWRMEHRIQDRDWKFTEQAIQRIPWKMTRCDGGRGDIPNNRTRAKDIARDWKTSFGIHGHQCLRPIESWAFQIPKTPEPVT